jgi:hypothetical protein
MQLNIEVAGRTPAEAGQLAAELETALRTCAPRVQADRHKRSFDTMDVGTIVGVVFGSAAMAAVGQGISAWLAKRQNAEITIKGPDDTVIIKGITSAHAVDIVKVLKPLVERNGG